MPNSRETEKLNIEIQRHDEIFQALADLTAAVRNLEVHSMERDKKVDEMYSVFNNGKFLTQVVKWGFGTLLAMGGAYLMVKSIIHEQN